MIDFLAFAGFGWLRGVKGMAPWGLSLVAASVAGAYLARPVGLWLASFGRLPLLAAVMAATAAHLMSDPARARETLGALVRDPRVRELAADAGVRADLVANDTGDLSRTPTLRALAADADFVTAARRVRILPDGPEPTVTPQQLAAALAEKVGPLIRTADALAQDPDVRAALEDPDFKAALARGDMAALLAQRSLDEILQRVSSELERLR